MAVRFSLIEFGRAFATRERGSELREEVQRRAVGHGAVVLDFGGVRNVSYSFADEFLGMLHAEGSVAITEENMADGVARVARRAVERRAGAVC